MTTTHLPTTPHRRLCLLAERILRASSTDTERDLLTRQAADKIARASILEPPAARRAFDDLLEAMAEPDPTWTEAVLVLLTGRPTPTDDTPRTTESPLP